MGRGTSSDGKDGDDAADAGIRFGGALRKVGGRGESSTGASRAAVSTGELVELKGTIQSLAAASIPLGKAIDYVAQDSEDMRAEMEAWSLEAMKRAEVLDRERRETAQVLAPLRRELTDADERVRDIFRKISVAKAAVTRNDARIRELVRAASSRP